MTSAQVATFSLYGDCCCIDSTFATNRYKMAFVSVQVFDACGVTRTVCQGLLRREDAASYRWYLRAMRSATQSRAPLSMFSDGDLAIARAIADVLPRTQHCLCAWHLQQNIRKNMRPLLEGDFDRFAKMFAALVFETDSSVGEYFSFIWIELVRCFYNVYHLPDVVYEDPDLIASVKAICVRLFGTRFAESGEQSVPDRAFRSSGAAAAASELAHGDAAAATAEPAPQLRVESAPPYIAYLYSLRAKWAGSLIAGQFVGTMRSTQRSESLHAALKRLVIGAFTLQLLREAMATVVSGQIVRASERPASMEAVTQAERVLKRSLSPLAAELAMVQCRVADAYVVDVAHVHERAPMTAILVTPKSAYEVLRTVSLVGGVWRCSCRMTLWRGLPCRHIAAVFIVRQRDESLLALCATRWLTGRTEVDPSGEQTPTPGDVLAASEDCELGSLYTRLRMASRCDDVLRRNFLLDAREQVAKLPPTPRSLPPDNSPRTVTLAVATSAVSVSEAGTRIVLASNAAAARAAADAGGDMSPTETVDDVVTLEARMKYVQRGKGRPGSEARFRSADELSDASAKRQKKTCGKCHKQGHNKTTCHLHQS
jgi:hypothetical protein